MFRRIRPIIIKELRQIRRDTRSLGLLLVFPAFLVFLIGYALNFDVKHVKLAILDQDRSPRSREYIRAFSTSEYFDIGYNVGSYADLTTLLNEGKAQMAVVTPVKFAADLLAGRDVDVQFLVDGSDANTATMAIGYAASITQTYSASIATAALARSGRESYVPVDFRPKIWYNPELVSAKFLLPGLFGFILMLSAVISTSLSVVREKEHGTMEQLMISRLHTAEIIIGKTIPYLAVSLLSSVLILATGYIFFQISVRGSLVWFYAGTTMFLLGALGQGLFISTIAPNQQMAFLISVLTSLLPTFLLSGFVFPISSMPVVLQILSNITPTKFYLIVVRGIILKGVGLAAFWDQLLYMAIFAGITLTLSSVRLLRRAE